MQTLDKRGPLERRSKRKKAQRLLDYEKQPIPAQKKNKSIAKIGIKKKRKVTGKEPGRQAGR